ncbi:hypothetical protein [Lysobacter gummosus]|uniref:hypothetical protein n=1 Tax=Lysobacter gummosus TaxID=262324 RepID=UPI003643967E
MSRSCRSGCSAQIVRVVGPPGIPGLIRVDQRFRRGALHWSGVAHRRIELVPGARVSRPDQCFRPSDRLISLRTGVASGK